MTEKLLAAYEGKCTIFTRSTINRYHFIEKVECMYEDNSWFRENGALENGKPISDRYIFYCYNYKGDRIYGYHKDSVEEAREFLKGLLHNQPWLKRVH